MVLSFFRRGDSGMTHITSDIVAMLGEARHSFDVATGAVLDGGDVDIAAADVVATDDRINRAEYQIRRELIVHVSVHGAADIAQVLGYTLLVKKVERLGDQAKNILDLALEGVSLADAPDRAELEAARRSIIDLYDDVAAVLSEPDEARVAEVTRRGDALQAVHAAHVLELVHSDEPGRVAVPRAVLHRYLKRIVANLVGIAMTVTEPLPLPADDHDDD
ncbi:MAG: PhoU domain-containing protein [Ilumatobacter sp.]|nr:MAG: PhoU domain-containing protein [Ilumatobacter sp.]